MGGEPGVGSGVVAEVGGSLRGCQAAGMNRSAFVVLSGVLLSLFFLVVIGCCLLVGGGCWQWL